MPQQRRRVCFVLPSLNGGGAERAAVQILNGLDPEHWERSMFLFAREGPYLSEVAVDVRVDAADVASRTGRWHALRRHVRDRRPDLVMAFLSYFSVLTAVRAANTGARVAFNQQTPMSEFLTDADYHWRRHWHKAAFSVVTRIGYGAVDLVIATSRGVARDLTKSFGVDPARIAVLPNPVDLDRVRLSMAEPIDPQWLAPGAGPLVVAAGRLADAKNYPLLIDAFALLCKHRPARLWILGQGEREGALRQRIADRGLTNVVTLLGFQPNPWKFIARADVFVLTSRYEGFGNVLIEAMACGVPVVATASPGTIDIVSHDVDGVLVQTHDADSVAAAMRRVLDPSTRARLAGGARRSAARFGLPIAIERYEAVLGGMLT